MRRGFYLLRRLWNRLEIGAWWDERLAALPGRFRLSLLVEQ